MQNKRTDNGEKIQKKNIDAAPNISSKATTKK